MSIFPSNPTIGDQYSGYEWDGTVWYVIGVDLAQDYATQTYVDNAIASFEALPSQTGHGGEFLTTDGSATSWAETTPATIDGGTASSTETAIIDGGTP